MKTTYHLTQHLARMVLAVALALGVGAAFGQNLLPIKDSYDIVAEAGIAQYGGGQYAEIGTAFPDWKTRWPFYYERERFLGRSEAEMARATPLVAVYQHYVWGTSANGVASDNISRANIKIGWGQWAVNRICDWAYGEVSGSGSGGVYANSLVPRGAGGTELVMMLDNWMFDPACKVNLPELGTQDNLVACAFRSVTFNKEGTVGAYHELAGLTNIHISTNAPPRFQPGRITCAALAWDLGSASEVGNVYVHNIDCAFICTRGTPARFDKITGMGGNLPMFLLLGTCDALYNFGSIECDDFPAVFMTRAQWGREAGARIVFGDIKIETAVTSEARNPWTGTILADLRGRNILHGGIVNSAEANVNVESMVVLDDRDMGGVQQPNLIDYIAGRWNMEANFVHEVNGNVYGNPSGFPYDGQELFYKRAGASRTVQVDREAVAPTPGVVGFRARLGFQRWNGTAWAPAFSHSAGTPAFSYASASTNQPAPSPCTYTYSAWSSCTNGSQTRTVVSSTPAGCTGTPVLSQACSTTTPPPSGTAIYTSPGAVNITSDTYRLPFATPLNVRRIVITGYKVNGTPNYNSLAYGALNGTNYISVLSDGSMITPAGRCTITTANGVTTIVLPAPMSIAGLGTPNSGGALRYTATKLELFAQ